MPCWFKKRDGAKPHKQQLRIRMHPLKQHLSFFSFFIYIFVFFFSPLLCSILQRLGGDSESLLCFHAGLST